MASKTIQLSDDLYRLVEAQAAQISQTPDDYVADLVAATLFPADSHIEMRQSRSGLRPVIKGTNVGVDVVMGYAASGSNAEEIANEILPHLTLSQVQSALRYDRTLLDENVTVEEWKQKIEQLLGSKASQLFGESVDGSQAAS